MGENKNLGNTGDNTQGDDTLGNKTLGNEALGNETEGDKGSDDTDLEGAIKSLNDKIEEDIKNTVNNKNITGTQVQVQSGGKRITKLASSIKLLKMKLTKKKLQEQLKNTISKKGGNRITGNRINYNPKKTIRKHK